VNANEILDLIGDARDRYVWDAQLLRTGQIVTGKKRRPIRKIWLIAAIIALLLLLVGCTVAYVLSVRGMVIQTRTVTKEEHYGPNYEVIDATEITYYTISIQSFSDSPNQRAAKQWKAYTDKQWEKHLNEKEESSEDSQDSIPYIYQNYGCRTPEMMEKLDEILEENGLLLSEGNSVSAEGEDVDILFDTFQIPPICQESDYAEVSYYNAYFWQNGRYGFYLDIAITDETMDWPYPIYANFRCSPKAYFDNCTISLKDLEHIQEWEYALPEGGTALLVLEKEKALILVDQGDAFVSVYFNARMGVDYMSREMLERIADLFRFSLRPTNPSDEEWAAVEARLSELEKSRAQDQEEREAEKKKENYDEWVRLVLENGYDTDSLGYVFRDIDGNGVDDLLIGRDGYCTAIYWEVDGKTELLSNASSEFWICEDQVIGYTVMPGKDEYWFMRADNGTRQGMGNVRYYPGHPEGEYLRASTDPTQWGKFDVITKEEYDRVLSAHPRIPVSFQPLKEYPLDGPTPAGDQSYTFQEDYSSFKEKIRFRLTTQKEQWSRWAYDLLDLDGNGQKEMIWQEDDRFFLYTMLDGKVCGYSFLSDGSLTFCEDGIVEAVYNYGPVNKTYRYYRIDGGQSLVVAYLRYDVDADPENPWFFSRDASGQDRSLEPISEERFQAIRAKFTPLELDMKPIAEYPFDEPSSEIP